MSSENGATASRRKSGRAVKAPEKFAPEAPSSPAPRSNGKRKREVANIEQEEESGAVDEENEDEDEEEEEESADEEASKTTKKKAKPGRKPAAKKPKVNGTESHDVPVVRLPNRPKKVKKVPIADDSAEGLYAEVFTSDTPCDEAALTWLERYEQHNPSEMMHLVNLVLQACGSDARVTEDDINDPDSIPDKLNEIQEEEKGKNVVDYPLIAKAKGFQGFRSNLTAFFEHVVKSMHASGILYTEIALIENIHFWVTSMSSSYLRPFRHTATVISLAVATALCDVARDQINANTSTRGFMESEKKKRPLNKGRVETFQKNLTEGEERVETCQNTIRDFFDTVFVHRYRDIDPKIRLECVDVLGRWIAILPSIFLEPSYLRYLGWMLSDTFGSIRTDVLKQLEKLLKQKTNIGRLRNFLDRFRPRIVEMSAQDSEVSVRVAAIELLDGFREAGMLEPQDIDSIGKLIFDSEVRVRKAVVGFFAENIKDMNESKIDELGGQEVLDDVFTADEDNHDIPHPEWILLKCVAEGLLDYDQGSGDDSPTQVVPEDSLITTNAESRFSLAAQALYDRIPEIREWQTIAGYLLFDHSSSGGSAVDKALRESFRLDEKEEAILLEVLYASFKMGLDPLDEDGSKSHKKRTTSRMELKEAQESLAQSLAALLPRLMQKFSANPITTTAVLRLEQLLNLGVFQQLRQDNTAYASLLQEISRQFSGHADQRVMAEASAALLHAKTFDELGEVTEEKVQLLWEVTLDDFRSRLKNDQVSVRGDLNAGALGELANTVARIDKLAGISDPVERFEAIPTIKGKATNKAKERAKIPVIDLLIECVGRGLLEEPSPEIDAIEDQLCSSACQAALLYFMWKTRSLMEVIKASKPIAEHDIEQFRDRQAAFTKALIDTLSSRADVDDLRLFATGTLLDLTSLTSTFRQVELVPQDKEQYADVLRLIQPINELDVQEELTSIFALLEKKFAKKARKILEAPADDDEPEDFEEDEEDEDEELSDAERKSELLLSERQLCDLASKLVIAILAGVLDNIEPSKGKLRSRIQRNRLKLGPNFKEVIAYLDEPKPKAAKKSHKSKAQQPASATTKSAEVIEDGDDDDEDILAEDEPEEGTADDLRMRELLDEEPEAPVDEDAEAPPVDADDDDDIMGD